MGCANRYVGIAMSAAAESNSRHVSLWGLGEGCLLLADTCTSTFSFQIFGVLYCGRN